MSWFFFLLIFFLFHQLCTWSLWPQPLKGNVLKWDIIYCKFHPPFSQPRKLNLYFCGSISCLSFHWNTTNGGLGGIARACDCICFVRITVATYLSLWAYGCDEVLQSRQKNKKKTSKLQEHIPEKSTTERESGERRNSSLAVNILDFKGDAAGARRGIILIGQSLSFSTFTFPTTVEMISPQIFCL